MTNRQRQFAPDTETIERITTAEGSEAVTISGPINAGR